MWEKSFRSTWIALAMLSLLLLAACTPDNDPKVKIFPTVVDPDIEINVTPGPTPHTGHFTVTVQRVGTQNPNIGWYSKGEVYLSVPINLDDPENPDDSLMLTGVGFGRAGFDASGNNCIDIGGWPVEYSAYGFFDVKTCEVNITIEEVWPRTEAFASCAGASGSASGGVYKLQFPNLKFPADDPREDTTTDKDQLFWVNTFKLYPKDGLEDTDCEFSTPTGD